MTDFKRDEQGRPIPDGHLHIVTGVPLNPEADTKKAESYDQYFFFCDLEDYKEVPTGIRITWSNGNPQIIPWNNIRTWDIQCNSEEFREQLDLWVLSCDHEMTEHKQAGTEGGVVKYCAKCQYTEERIEYTRRALDQRLQEDLKRELD